ncbi:capsular polysaccharide biosynthesis protein CapF [Metabacillus litoralis]|uniref:Capsular polysaccharide biosynthesis protein CapF n=1 Tax=Metabacillus litoralis TaxID=152268 RepID=A0A5C6VAE4_9BACI|nr:capsular polysaccharide biosynthesis protein CapF [Metabacillus litoralis]TXC82189.1 capsular polysaccharide biosynthesis protein CapF [Metabacillus litoralis]
MKILVTGAKGFVGKNLIAELKNRKYTDILEFTRETDQSLLDEYCKDADFVFHLAGVNRPKDQSEFMDGNLGFTSTLLEMLKRYQNTCPILISSSTQAELDNLYGISKKAGEDLLFEYSKETGAKVFVYRFPNVFGKWCRPNYNSAVATFCHNVAHEFPINVNDPSVVMNLVYIDDVVEELISALNGKANVVEDFCEVPVVHEITLGEIVNLIYSFKKSRIERSIPDMSNSFTKKLYSTYLSYLPEDQFSYDLKMNVDQRGSFTEFIKTPDRGQVSVNISKPGITKGNHWHHTKNEKFLVVSGTGVIRFRKIGTEEIIEYFVSGDKIEVVDIPTGYTHNIENLGETDMVTIMWANEYFDPEKPDTYFLEV